MVKRNKFKVCGQLRENIWNSYKILNFKKKKWIRYKRFLLRNRYKFKLIPLFNRRRSENLKYTFSSVLNLKRKIRCFFGAIRFKKLKKMIRKKNYVALSEKKSLLDTNYVRSFPTHLQNNRLRCNILTFESTLSVLLMRANFFKNINICRFVIFSGGININLNVSTNPLASVMVGDVISVNNEFTKFIEIGLLFRTPYLLVDLKNLKFVYTRLPTFKDLVYPSIFDWGLLQYILKIKR